MGEELQIIPEVDDILAAYIRAVETTEGRDDIPEKEKTVDIILTFGGMVITGQLISFKTYYRESMETGEVESDDSQSETESQSSTEAVETVEIDHSGKRRDYIHLRGAKFYAPNISSDGDGVHWRGKLSAVSGFAFGTFQKPERKPHIVKVGNVKLEI